MAGGDSGDTDHTEESYAAQARRRRRSSIGSVLRARRSGDGSAVTRPAALDRGQLADLYNSCIRLNTENKINAKNSWSLQLLEHLPDVMVTQLDDHAAASGSTTNFQAASCTLAASIKIYSYRVDAVHSDTYKVLDGLSRTRGEDTNDRADNNDSGGRDEDDDDDDENDNERSDDALAGEDGNLTAQSTRRSQAAARRKRPATGSQTLASSAAQISLAADEDGGDIDAPTAASNASPSAVDPLHQKLSHAFDELAAEDALTARLPTLGSTAKLFDSPCTTIQSELASLELTRPTTSPETEQPGPASLPTLAALASLSLCATFKDYSFIHANSSVALDAHANSAAATTGVDHPSELEDPIEEIDWGMASELMPSLPAPKPGQQGTLADYLGMGDTGGADGLEADEDDRGFGDALSQEVVMMMMQTDDALAEDEPLPTAASLLRKGGQEDGGVSGLLGHLRGLRRGQWAGPEHWRFRLPSATGSASSTGKSGRGGRGGRTKQPFVIDFDAAEVGEESFAHSRAATTLTDAARRKMEDGAPLLLPEDKQLTLHSLTHLFLDPTRAISMPWCILSQCETVPDPSAQRRTGGFRIDDSQPLSGGGSSQTPRRNFVDEDEDEDDGFAEAQLYGQNDDEDANGAAEGPIGDQARRSLGIQWVDAPKATENIQIQYSRVAKNVDVRELKRCLWHEIETAPVLTEDAHPDAAADIDEESSVGGVSFRNAVQQLPKHMAKNRALQDASVPFAFICLLHLANEHGLEITQHDMSDLFVHTTPE